MSVHSHASSDTLTLIPLLHSTNNRGERKKTEMRKRAAAFGHKKFRSKVSFSLIVFEFLHCSIMLAAVAAWFIYAIMLVNNDAFGTRFNVYDADASAPARYFLPYRDTSGLNTSDLPLPGSKGRWELPANSQGLEDMNNMVNLYGRLHYYYGIYGLLQGLVMLLFFVKGLHLISFQPRLSAIPGGFVRMLPDLLHLTVITVLCGIMLMMLWIIVYGYRVASTSTLGNAAYNLAYLIFVGVDFSYAAAINPLVWSPPLELTVIYAAHFLGTFLLIWILKAMIITIIMASTFIICL